MIKNTTVLATKRCNSRCTMCNIWKEDTKEQEMSVQQFRELFSREEFRELEDLNISGGEPTLREDIIEVIRAISENMPKLNMFFLSTNGTNPQKTRDIFQDLSGKIKDLHLCVSIDGDRETNKMVRGIDSYETALKTIEICKKTTPEIHTIISSTLTSKNCDEETLNHIKKIAEKTGSTFSFRMAWKNGTYYKNTENDIGISPEQKKKAIDFMKKHCTEDPFMRAQIEYFETGRIPIMEKCYAGNVFVFVNEDGTIYPCINSSRKIGDKERGVFVRKISDLGKYEQCPCCTECCFYPLLNWSRYADK